MGSNMFGQNTSMANFAPADAWQNSSRGHGNLKIDAQFGAPSAPQSAQRDIVNTRRNQVSEHFGQITPPDDSAPESCHGTSSKEPSVSQKSREEDIAKLNRTQRARNAANKRHSKSKTARRGSDQDNNDEAGEGDKDQSKSTSMQREKNRVAAAKCRAKKKANSEEMQETHREGAKENSYLHREVRELRDQKAFLRNTLLQHEPGVCQCHAIHQFNMAQAQQLAFGVGAMTAYQPMSPSQESVGSGHSPSSDASAGRTYPAPGMVAAPRRMSVPSRRQSVVGPSNYTFGQITSPDPTVSINGTAPDASQMPHQFSEFLHSSPQGRAGFS